MPPPGVRERTKVVVRNLPAELSEGDFRSVLEEVLQQRTFHWFRYVPGKASLKRDVRSCAYIHLENGSDVLLLSAGLDGHAFPSSQGRQLFCHVQYAPYQKVPRAKPRRDPREGTLSKDSEFNDFVENLGRPPAALPSAEMQLQVEEQTVGTNAGDTKIVITPLMEFLRQKHAKKSSRSRVIVKPVPAKQSGRKGKDRAVKEPIKPDLVPQDAKGPTKQTKDLKVLSVQKGHHKPAMPSKPKAGNTRERDDARGPQPAEVHESGKSLDKACAPKILQRKAEPSVEKISSQPAAQPLQPASAQNVVLRSGSSRHPDPENTNGKGSKHIPVSSMAGASPTGDGTAALNSEQVRATSRPKNGGANKAHRAGRGSRAYSQRKPANL